MNYDDPELRDRLAADYALGLLRGAARRRFERLVRSDPSFAEVAERWQLRLNLLSETTNPVEPPEHVWRAVAARIASPDDAGRVWPAQPEGHAMVPRRLMTAWRAVGVAATALAAGLAVYVATRNPVDRQTSLAVLADDSGHAAYVAIVDGFRRKLELTQIGDTAPPTGKSYELWLLPHGAKPVAVAVLPQQRHASFDLPPGVAQNAQASNGLAISQEPVGGSPTGQPTGPILFMGAVIAD